MTRIEQRERLSKELFIIRTFHKIKYNDKILLAEQDIVDKNGSYIRSLGEDQFVTRIEEKKSSYKYKYDKRGNWILKKSKDRNKSNRYVRREIEYY